MSKKIERINKLQKEYKEIIDNNTKKRSYFSYSRLVLFIFLVFTLYMSFTYYNFWFAIAAVTLVSFITLSVFYKKYDKVVKDNNYKLTILKQYLFRFDNKYRTSSDSGFDLKSDLYLESDLDIFGKSSLYSYLSFSNTPFGRIYLADSLRGNVRKKEEIKLRQEAIHELASNLESSVSISAKTLKYKENASDIKASNVENGFNMIEREIEFNPLKLIISIALSLVFITTVVLAILKVINPYFCLASFIINFFLTRILFKEINELSSSVISINEAFIGYDKIVEELKNINFNSSLLNSYKDDVNKLSNKALASFNRICGCISSRTNIIFQLIFNGVFLADAYFIYLFKRWQKKNSASFRNAILSIGRIEELISLATIEVVKEESSIPTFSDKFIVKNIKHPLIQENVAVGNDFDFKGTNIITGSNMSGKTTFMRSIGVNYVLFLAGSSVVSSHFEAPICPIFTSMKVVDDVNNNISTFYGEILRIKNICTSLDKQIIVLVDEIFKGTNTKDRIEGSSQFIRRLIDAKSYAIISTHDRELCEIEDVHNFYFKEHYVDGKIEFDYQINEGVSNTSNAIYLLEMAGIINLNKN